MLIREMSQEECLKVLRENRLARLASAHENQPYIVPVYLGFDESTHSLYGFTTLGQKIDWMRMNPKVCVEVDEINADHDWTSVVATGRFEELAEYPRKNGSSLRRPERAGSTKENLLRDQATLEVSHADERQRAWEVLRSHPEWWEPGCSVWTSRSEHNQLEQCTPIFYRVVIETMTGHHAIDSK